MSTTEYKFQGWGGFDPDSVKGNLKWFEYTPKTWAEEDIDVKIHACGVCGTDLHMLSSGWMDMTEAYPQVVGHEIVGEVVRVGSNVNNVKVGDFVGIGAQCDSCGKCHECDRSEEPYCKGMVSTYSDVYKSGIAAGEKTYGGYANYWRGPASFAIPIPAHMELSDAAPFLCGGVTVYAPLEKYGAGTEAKEVGVVGIGGLGHFAVLMAKAMGANVTAITHGASKVETAKELGADTVIVTGDDAATAVAPHGRTLDLIICTSNDAKLPLSELLSLLRPGGRFIVIGIADGGVLPQLSTFQLVMNNIHVGGSLIGSPAQINRMFQLVADKQIKPWVVKRSMKDANQTIVDMHEGKAKFRYVLVNEENGGKL